MNKFILNSMEPREKAIELRDRMHTEIGWGYHESINCAIVAADGIISSIPSLPRNVFLDLDAPDWMDKEYALMFWRNVKIELEAMK